MNTRNLSLSSTTTSKTQSVSPLNLDDYTTLRVFLSGMTEKLLPMLLKIDWGDGSPVENYENDILQTESLIEDRFSSLFLNNYTHDYTPSGTSTSKSLTATFTINYINNDTCLFYVPITVTNRTYYTSVEDLYLINTIIIPNDNNDKIQQFVTKRGGYMVELRTSTK